MGKHNLKALTSLALLSTPIFSSDYLSTFLPFVATLTIKKKYKKIEISKIVTDFSAEYGLYIPRAPMQSILSKAVKEKLIELKQDGTYRPNVGKMTNISFLHKEAEEEKNIDQIIEGLIKFAKEKYNIDYDKQKAGEVLIGFLNEYSPKSMSVRESDIDTIYTKNATNSDLFLVASFIKKASRENATAFKIVQNLCFAYLIVIAMSFDEPIEGRVKGLSNLTIYLDTKIVFRLLGLETEELRDAYLELFDMFKKYISPKFKVFRHTMDEMLGILYDCANWINKSGYIAKLASPAMLAFVSRQFSESQIRIYINNFEQKLNENGISVDDVAYYDVVYNAKQINEEEYKKMLVETYKKHNPIFDDEKSNRTLQNDITSIANIVKLWGNKSSRTYATLGYVFLTCNTSLAHVSRKYTDNYWWDSRKHISPCITDYYLGTMIWLSTPANEMQSVSKLKLLADCSAATSLSKNIMDKFLVELEKLKSSGTIKSEDYLLLRNESYKNNYLQELTLNDENGYNDDIPEAILEKIKEDIKKPLVDKIAELENRKSVQDQKIKDYEEKEKEEKNAAKLENEKIQNKAEKITNDIEMIFLPVIATLIGGYSFAIGDNVSLVTCYLLRLIVIIDAVIIGLLKTNKLSSHDRLLKKITFLCLKCYKIRKVFLD